jgi:carbon-monoxide dehydrogenase medium subunit
MKASAFEYARARDAGHAVTLLAQAGPDARPIAGGQSLGPMLNLRLARPSLLVDISRGEDLRGVGEEPDAVLLGAAITHAEVEDGVVPDPTGGWLRHAARRIAYRAVRNRGTLGGSLAHGDPAGDWLTVLLALDSEVVLRGPSGSRALRLADFATGPFSNALAPGEVLVAIRIPRHAGGIRMGYRKLSVKHGEFARAFAVTVHPAQGPARAVVGAVERRPLLIEEPDLPADLDSARALLAARLPQCAPAPLQIHAVNLLRALGDLQAGGSAP